MCRNKAYYHDRKRQYHHSKRQDKWAKFQAHRQGLNYALVNVQELDDSYELHINAAGYTKKDFKLSLVDNILTISVEQKKIETPENARWKKREYWQRGFERQFELNDKINTDSIAATYKNGILNVTLPKLEDKITARQDIELK